MANLNKVLLIGNVGNDPEVRYLESQNPGNNAKVASFRLATTERYRDRSGELRENTEWHNIVVWRGNADVVDKFVRKGSQLYIEGKLRTRQWTDQTGAKRYTTEVVADTLQLLGRRADGDGAAAPGAPSASPQASAGYGSPAYSTGAPSSGPAAPAFQGGPQAPAGPAPASNFPSGPAPAEADSSDDLPF